MSDLIYNRLITFIYIFISPILVCIIAPCHGSFYIQPGGLQIFRIHEGGGSFKYQKISSNFFMQWVTVGGEWNSNIIHECVFNLQYPIINERTVVQI